MSLTQYYVSGTGTGGSGTQGDPWKWDTFSTRMKAGGAAAAGDVYNIKEGTYTLSATDTWANPGTATSPIVIQGCKSDWTVLTPSRTSSGFLDTTHMPYINYNGNYYLSCPAYLIISGLRIAAASAVAGIYSSDYSVWAGCSITNYGSNSLAQAMYGATYSAVINCDLSDTGASTGPVLTVSANTVVAGCIFSAGKSYGVYSVSLQPIIVNCLFYGLGDYAIWQNAVYQMVCLNNTIYGKGIGFSDQAYTNPSVIIGNCITDGAYAINNAHASATQAIIAYNRTRNNSSGAISWVGDWVSVLVGEVTSYTGNGTDPAQDYANYSTNNFSLATGSVGKNANVLSSDFGALHDKSTIIVTG